MKKRITKYFSKNKDSINNKIDIDNILDSYGLNYSELNFEEQETNIIKSYTNLNKKLNANSSYLKNLKAIFPSIPYRAILKPLYTIAITSIIIFTIIELKDFTKPVEYAEVTVDAGEKITLHITNEITVWLNSESSIRIPMELKRNSKIYLSGEGYFEIKPSEKTNKFKIISKGIEFQSFNGSFNINSNEPGNVLISHIKDGSVVIYNPNLPKSTKLTLIKDDKLTYNPIAELIAIEKSNNTNYLVWKTGLINFNNTSLLEVASFLNKYYEVPVTIENSKLKNKRFTASFQDADIDEILDEIMAKFNCTVSGDGKSLIIN